MKKIKLTMPIDFHPPQGSVLTCDFSTGFTPPEMIKRRPVVIVSPIVKSRPGLCTVVCLSTVKPEPIMPYHMPINLPEPLPQHWKNDNVWLKGDMIYSVSFHRLQFATLGKSRSGRRLYYRSTLSKDVFLAVQGCILNGFGLSYLTKHMT